MVKNTFSGIHGCFVLFFIGTFGIINFLIGNITNIFNSSSFRVPIDINQYCQFDENFYSQAFSPHMSLLFFAWLYVHIVIVEQLMHQFATTMVKEVSGEYFFISEYPFVIIAFNLYLLSSSFSFPPF